MSHLSEKLAEFVFEELSAAEMAEAKQHLAQCSGCREEVSQFQVTQAMLRTSADAEPPRRIMFEFERPRVASWMWRWLGPMTASAAVALAVIQFAPRPQPVAQVLTVQAPATQPSQPAAQQIDYQKIVNDLRASEQTWLANELKKQDASRTMDIQRVSGELALLDYKQRMVSKETTENASSIQLLAQR